jgi:hypothetical protein
MTEVSENFSETTAPDLATDATWHRHFSHGLCYSKNLQLNFAGIDPRVSPMAKSSKSRRAALALSAYHNTSWIPRPGRDPFSRIARRWISWARLAFDRAYGP